MDGERCLYHLRDSDALVAGQIVQGDGIAWAQLRNENLGDIGLEGVTVDRPTEHLGLDEAALSHRVLVGRAEIGAASSKRSNEGRDYPGLKLDDPSFNAPIYANLFDDKDGEAYSLICSRASRRNGD